MKMLRRLPAFAGWLHMRQLIQCRSCSGLSETVTSNSTKEFGDEAVSPRRNSRLRQMALLVAYHGDKYYGMELLRNTGFPTVEEALFRALQRSGAVAEGGAPSPPHYSRASRTDRGVSALGQVVSLRMRVWDGVLDDINCHLPADVRVCDMRRVPPRFSAQLLCDDRLYSYTLPTLAFTPMEQPVTLDYRLTNSRLEEVRQLLQQYVGSHSFHSFSPGGNPDAAQMTRHIISVDVDEPYRTHGLEFTTIWIRGGSFVLSQIRRMVGLVLAVCRGAGGRHALRDAMAHQRLTGTTAPGLGLILRQARFETVAAAPWNVHGPLRWSEESSAAVSQLETRLLDHIHTTEAADMVTFRFLDGLLHNRIGALVKGQSSFRSPLGYALMLTTKEGDIPEKTEVTEVTPSPTEVTKVTPDSTEISKVTPDPSEVTKVMPDLSEVTQVIPDPSEVSQVIPDASEVTKVIPDPSEVTQVIPDLSEVTKVMPDSSEVTTVIPDPSEVTKVIPDPSEVTKVIPDLSEVTQGIPDLSEVTKVIPDPSKVTKVIPDPSEVTKVTADAVEVTEVTSDPKEMTEMTPSPSEVTEVTPDRTEVTKVR